MYWESVFIFLENQVVQDEAVSLIMVIRIIMKRAREGMVSMVTGEVVSRASPSARLMVRMLSKTEPAETVALMQAMVTR